MSVPSFREAAAIWARVGLLSFGGPAGQIALMHRLIVEDKKWLDEASYLRALNLCMLLPGPEAQQLATYVGWRMHGIKGGLVAGGLFILPGALILLGLSLLYVSYGSVPAIEGLFLGIQAVVVAVVIEALQRLSKRALKGRTPWVIAALAFTALFFFNVPFPLVILIAGIVGTFTLKGRAIEPHATALPRPVFRKSVLTLVAGLSLWFAPVAAAQTILGRDHVLTETGVFFSKMAVVTFGGAYAVLAYVAQEAVNGYGWLTTTEMIQGLGLAETTPGPLILTLQYVGFLAGWRNAAPFDPFMGGLLASAMTLWVTFVPCFLWIFLIAPYMSAIERIGWLSAALSGITAAVTGVVLSLSLWFTLHVLFGVVDTREIGLLHLHVPELSTLNLPALIIAVAAGIALLRFHMGLLKVLAAGAIAGIIVALMPLAA